VGMAKQKNAAAGALGRLGGLKGGQDPVNVVELAVGAATE